MIVSGAVIGAHAGFVSVRLPGAFVGQHLTIESLPLAFGTVRALEAGVAHVAITGSIDGIATGTRVRDDGRRDAMMLGSCVLGRAIDAHGRALDGGVAPFGMRVPLDTPPPAPDARGAIAEPLWTGVRAIDALLTVGRGARVGIFGAPGLGKSTLLETIVRGTCADAVVVGAIGERGREAQRWIEQRDTRTTIICATSDRSAAERVRAANVTLAHAEALAARGLHVLVLLDSLARTASAARELALTAGENVGRGGYPPSVFADLARLVERAGTRANGSITLFATVLNDGDDRDPVSEAARSLLDGHIQLSSALAQRGHFPAIDVLASASRTMSQVTTPAHRVQATRVRDALARLDRVADARALGIEAVDEPTRTAIAAEGRIASLLRQDHRVAQPEQTLVLLAEIADTLEGSYGYHE